VPIPVNPRLIIVGSGIVGSSAAYHLARLGWHDILVLDKGDPVHNDGSTSHAPGGVVALSHNKLLTQMAQYSTKLLAGLAPYREDRKMYNPVGTLEVAVSQPRMEDLVRLNGEAKGFGVTSHLLTPDESVERLPYMDASAFVGALLVPDGAIVAPPDVNGALQRDAAATGGVRFVGNTTVTDIAVEGGTVVAVLTDNPEAARIECEQVLICTNIWGPLLGERTGVPIPLTPHEHQYMISHPLAELASFDPANPADEIVYPSVRELDTAIYFRQSWNAFGVGSYHHRPRPLSPSDIGKSAIHEFTAADFVGEAWEKARNLFPILAGSDPRDFPHRINGIFAFTADGMPIMGESSIGGLWVAVGSWLTHAPGVGKSIAEWMTTGEAEWDMRQVHLHRFAGYQTTPSFIRRICDKNYREVYEITHPRQPLSEPRGVRLSPFHPRLEELKPVFTTFAGLELPNWFESNQELADRYAEHIPDRRGWGAMHWSPIQGGEHLATREGAALFDLTGLSIIEVRGGNALEFVNYLCSNQMDRKVGAVIYTTWLTPRGGIRRDLTVARLGKDRFWMFVGEGTRPMDLRWVEENGTGFTDLVISDLSDAYGCVGLWGPRARALLSKVTSADLSNPAFPYFSAQTIDIGYSRALALRISYAGELGWELHFGTDQALPVWDILWEAGQESDLVPAGMGAFDSLRLEKGYRGWGTDIHTEYDPYQAGLSWTVRLDKTNFIGAEACRGLAASPPDRKLCCLTFDDRDAVALGNEPIMVGDECIGQLTSANFGYSVGRFIGYGYLPAGHAELGSHLEVEHGGHRFGATVAPDPLFDPQMTRMKA
jgi:glycine cleavage system aminomethyltransferase T/glycine/D-amino acid oxidase-like deaminating enzyme